MDGVQEYRIAQLTVDGGDAFFSLKGCQRSGEVTHPPFP